MRKEIMWGMEPQFEGFSCANPWQITDDTINCDECGLKKYHLHIALLPILHVLFII